MGEGEKGPRAFMKLYEIEFIKRASNSLKKIDKTDLLRITAAIELMKTDPIPPNARRLSGSTNYRLRVGNFRIIYAFSGKKLLILILEIGHRSNVYRKR